MNQPGVRVQAIQLVQPVQLVQPILSVQTVQKVQPILSVQAVQEVQVVPQKLPVQIVRSIPANQKRMMRSHCSAGQPCLSQGRIQVPAGKQLERVKAPHYPVIPTVSGVEVPISRLSGSLMQAVHRPPVIEPETGEPVE